MKTIKIIWRCLLSLSIAWFQFGCATSTVLNRPPKKDLALIHVGTPRGLVLAELGAPISNEIIDGRRREVFAFDKGVSGIGKFGRGFFHLAADVFTLFLWELIAWPSEKVAAHSNTKLEIAYDENDKVISISHL